MSALAQSPSQAAVCLTQMLDRRDTRVAGQRALLNRFGRPVVSLTLVYPGPVKDTAQARFVHEQALAGLHAALTTAGHPVLAREQACLVTGPEALQAVDADPRALKRLLVALEDLHPLGRLWDLDLIAPNGAGISRQQLGLPARRCLLCDEPAHACARSGAHTLAALQRAIRDKIDAYRDGAAN
jgi:holo-ACP synthase